METMNAAFAKMEAKITGLSSKVGELEEKNKKQAIEIKELKQENKRLKQENKRLNDKIIEQDARITGLEGAKEELEDQVKALTSKGTKLMKQNEKLLKDNEELLKDNEELKTWNKKGWDMLMEHRGLTTKGELIDFAIKSIKKLVPDEQRREAIETILRQEKKDRNTKNHTMYERHVEGIVDELVDKLNDCSLLTRKKLQKLRKDLAIHATKSKKDFGESPPKLDETRQDRENFQSPASIRSRRVW